MNRKRIFWVLLLLTPVVLFALAFQHYRVKEPVLMWKYDLFHAHPPVDTKAQLDSIWDTFEKVPFRDLDPEYLEYTLYSVPKYKKLLGKPTFLRIKGEQVFHPLVGNIRVKDFFPRDHYYRTHLRNLEDSTGVLWLMDKRVLYRFIELRQELKKLGHDPDAFKVYNGFRYPKYNEKVGGAKMSRHMKGEAVDVTIRDIDRNGKADSVDKAIVLELLNKKIIRSTGGIGRYPGTMSVHFDVRGYHARWDSY